MVTEYMKRDSREYAPVIKYLTSHNMPTNTPAILIALLPEPMVTQQLRIKIMRLERRMMDVRFGPFEHEEAMVIH